MRTSSDSAMPVGAPPAEHLLSLARRIAVEAGELASLRWREGVQVADTKSTSTDVVTEADRETEDFIRRALRTARPDDGFLGEESAGSAGTSGLTWVVDPIDGTVNFLYGIPHWAVSIAVVSGEPDPATWTALAGAVVEPSSGDVYTAGRGQGAYLGDRALQVNSDVALGHALVGTGFGYSAERRAEQGTIVSQLLPQIRDIRRIGSAALDLCALASGRLDAYYEIGLNPWDHAAGALIAREAGARVGALGGATESAELFIAAEPVLFDELSDALRASGVG